jgi:hypothetical protein
MTMSTTSHGDNQASGAVSSIGGTGLPVRRLLVTLMLVSLLTCAVAAVWVSAVQAPLPRNMPFGVTGASRVVTVAQSRKISGYQLSFVNTTYPDEAAATDAINKGKIYGAYIAGTSSDTLLISQAKSFFAYTEILPLFSLSAKALHRPLAVNVLKPLPAGKDPVGAVAGTLLTATIVGGVVAAIMLFGLTRLAVRRWRGFTLVGITLLGALATDVIAGPVFGAYAGDRFWPLLPCLWLVSLSTSLVGAALIAVLPAAVAIVALLTLYIYVGMVTAGSSGVALLPIHWQSIGALLPPRYGVGLYQNVLYFSSQNITTPILVLFGYGLVATAVLAYAEWIRPRSAAAHSRQAGPGTGRTGASGKVRRALIAATVIAVLFQAAFTTSFISAGHNPVSTNMPFAATGNSSLTSAVEKTGSIKATSYPDEKAAKKAIGQAKAWGALFPHAHTNRLLTVPSISDLAPYTLPAQFIPTAKSQAQKVIPTSYTPTKLAKGDPFGLVLAVLLGPLLLLGYQVVSFVKMGTRVTAGPLFGVGLIGFAIVATLLMDLIAGPWLNGVPTDKFWILWAIMALVMSVVTLIAAVLQRLLGAVGTLLTLVVIILLGKPSSGGANGVAFLPAFWRDIWPFFPPRNAYILMRNTVYFSGNGTTQALIVLLVYLVVFAVILGILDWKHRSAPETPEVTPETEALTAATAVPASVAV